jgi:hypothetical protein
LTTFKLQQLNSAVNILDSTRVMSAITNTVEIGPGGNRIPAGTKTSHLGHSTVAFSSVAGSNRAERTPGMAAVSRYEQGAGGNYPSAPTFCYTDKQTLGSSGQSPGLLLTSYSDTLPHYLEPVANVVTDEDELQNCAKFFITVECKNGHRFGKELFCGKEYCPVCGAEWSDAHKRRFSRWLPKAEQIDSLGYFVFTLPKQVRYKYRTRESLNELTKKITCGDQSRKIRGILKDQGFTRGLSRWHWFGDQNSIYHPHLNVLVDGGYLSKKRLNCIREAYAEVLGVSTVDVNYRYTRVRPKMVHILKYVTRATFLHFDWDSGMAIELNGFRNNRSWGKWDLDVAWKMEGESQYEHIIELEHGKCPVCHEDLRKWSKAFPVCMMKLEAPIDIGAGYFRLDDIPPRPNNVSIDIIGRSTFS